MPVYISTEGNLTKLRWQIVLSKQIHVYDFICRIALRITEQNSCGMIWIIRCHIQFIMALDCIQLLQNTHIAQHRMPGYRWRDELEMDSRWDKFTDPRPYLTTPTTGSKIGTYN